MYDLVVIGGGLAGSALADAAAGRGLDVLLLDARPRAVLGGNWMNVLPREGFDLPGLLQPEGDELMDGVRRSAFVTVDGRGRYEVDVDAFVGLHVRPYVQRVLERAVARGARVWDGVRVLGLLQRGRAVEGVRTDRGEIRARVVADASGCAVYAGNPWLRALDPSPVRMRDVVPAFEGCFRVRDRAALEGWQNGTLKPYVATARLGAYGAYSTETILYRADEGRLDLLIGAKSPRGLAGLAPIVARRIRELGLDPRPDYSGQSLLPVRRPTEIPAYDGLVVLGDAASTTHAMHGSGTEGALYAGRLAAEVIASAGSGERLDQERLWPYACGLLRHLGPALAGSEALRIGTEILGERDARRLLSSGMVTAQDAVRSLKSETLGLPVREVPEHLLAVARSPRLALRMAPFLSGALLLQGLYRHYPATPDPQRLARWVTRVRTIVGRLERWPGGRGRIIAPRLAQTNES